MRGRRHTEVTVVDLMEQGIDAVSASCLRCGDEWQPPITFFPPATTIDKVAALLVCPTCGGRDIEIREPVRFRGRSVQ